MRVLRRKGGGAFAATAGMYSTNAHILLQSMPAVPVPTDDARYPICMELRSEGVQGFKVFDGSLVLVSL